MQQSHRLGERELGPHAYEDQYPPKIAAAVEKESTANYLLGVIPNLARLLQHNASVEAAYLCTDHTSQMLCFALVASGTIKSSDIPMHPTIPQLQDLIERAWDQGFNAHGRTLTGGIRGTRKHIGTSEAEALLLSHNISCTGTAFKGKDASMQLLDAVQDYFTASKASSTSSKINITARMPIFLQRPGHSITIVGFVRSKSGQCRLLTFDPAWRPPSKMNATLHDSDCVGFSAKLLLKRYRKSQRYFKRYKAFEILEVDLEG